MRTKGKWFDKYLFQIQNSSYDRGRTEWNYEVFNQDAMSDGQAWWIPEQDIARPKYERGAVFYEPDADSGKAGRVIKTIRLSKGEVIYDTELLPNQRATGSADLDKIFERSS